MIAGTLSSYIIGLLAKGRKKEQIIEDLLEKGHEEHFARQMVAEAIKTRAAKMHTQALTMILVGALICLGSCIITINSDFSSSGLPFVLYGCTTAGIVVVFIGFTKIF